MNQQQHRIEKALYNLHKGAPLRPMITRLMIQASLFGEMIGYDVTHNEMARIAQNVNYKLSLTESP